MDKPSPQSPPLPDAPLIEYRAPRPVPGPLPPSRARTLAWLFAIDIALAAGFIIFSYVRELASTSKWTHRDDPSLAIALAILAVLEAFPLCLCLFRWRSARWVGLIFASLHMALCGMAVVSLWLSLMFAPVSPGVVGWVGLYIVAAQGFCNVLLMSLLYGEVVQPYRRS